MEHEYIRGQALHQLEKIRAEIILAEHYDDWEAVGRRLCDLDSWIDLEINPWKKEELNDL